MTVASSSTGSERLARTTLAVLLGVVAGLLLWVWLVFAYQVSLRLDPRLVVRCGPPPAAPFAWLRSSPPLRSERPQGTKFKRGGAAAGRDRGRVPSGSGGVIAQPM
jgi:hypothetical protein